MKTIRDLLCSQSRQVATVYCMENSGKVNPVRCRLTGCVLLYDNGEDAVNCAEKVAKTIGQDGIAFVVVSHSDTHMAASVHYEDELGNVRHSASSRLLEITMTTCDLPYFVANVLSATACTLWNKVDGHQFDNAWYIDLPGNEKQLPYASRKYQTLPN